MRHFASIGPVRACIMLSGTAALIAAIFGLGPRHVTAPPVIVMPTVTVTGTRDPSTAQSVKLARRAVREGQSSSMIEETQ